MQRLSVKILIFIVAITCANTGATVGISVNAKCNIFGAGHSPPNDTPDVGPNGGGIAPEMISLATLSNAPALQFQPSGSVSFCSGCGLYGPEGDGIPYAAPGYNGISGITNMPGRALVGVFVGDSEPTNPAPAPLDFAVIGTNFCILAPQICQLFLIGAGTTPNGLNQTFIVPRAATRLYLGFVDGDDYPDSPDAYDDNSGSLSVSVGAALSLAVTYSAGSPLISVFGPLGTTNNIEYTPVLPAVSWTPLTNVVITNIPMLLYDSSSSGQAARFYRAMQLP
jgi:hypothetical protein